MYTTEYDVVGEKMTSDKMVRVNEKVKNQLISRKRGNMSVNDVIVEMLKNAEKKE